jgi:ribosome-associated protein
VVGGARQERAERGWRADARSRELLRRNRLEGIVMIRITEDTALDDREVEERFVRAIGPGGQNARKEATAVELRLDIGASSLPADVKERLISLAGRRVTTGGVLVVVSRAYRSQAENRDAAHARFVALLQRAAASPTTRRATKPRRAVREQRLASKKLRGEVKQSRSSRQRREE